MITKEKMPISHFQKVKEVIEEMMPKFFDSSYPDLEKLYKIKNRLSEMKPKSKSDLKQFEAVTSFYKIVSVEIKKGLSRLEETVSLLEDKRSKKESFLNNDKSGYDLQIVDQMYIAKTSFSLNGNELSISEKDEKKYDYQHHIDRMIWILHKFNRSGRKTFRIEEQLQHELLLTDVNNVDSIFFKLPYPSICFFLPYNNKLTIRKELIEYVYISERVQLGGSNDNSKKIELVYITKSGGIENHLFIIKEGMILEQIETQVDSNFQSPLAKKEAKEIISFILSSALYMNSNQLSYKDIFPLVIAKKQDSRYPVCSLGFDIVVNKDLHYTSNGVCTDRHLNVLKWTVRGHFRNYKKGDHWKENKIIWIRPFLKGMERSNIQQVIKPTNYILESSI